MIKFKTESIMEFESKADLNKVIAMMPWSEDAKVAFFETGEYSEDDEAEIDGVGTVDTSHKFTFTEE